MEPLQHLTGLGLVGSGCVRILAAYVLFIVLTRLASRSSIRHVFWLFFLIGASFYWSVLLTRVLTPRPFTNGATQSVEADVPAVGNSLPAKLTIPSNWDRRMKLATGVLVWAYAGGVILMFVRLARRRRSLRQAVSKAQPVSSGVASIFAAECHRLGASRCRILELTGLSSPGTAYIWKPVILIPDDLDCYLDGEQFVDVLYHELMHVRRLDFLWGTLADAFGCLLFFHPAFWLARRNLARERELACDEAVIELRRGRRTEYALSLARLARRRVLGCQLDPPSHLALLNSFLAFRVRSLLGGTHRRSRGAQGAAISAGLAALLIFFAGWSSLSMTIELAAPPVVTRPLVAQAGRSTASHKVVATRVKTRGRSAEVGQALSSPSAPREIPSELDVIAYQPVAAGERHDDWILSPQVTSGGSLPEAREQTVWDEAPPVKSAQNPRSWRRIVVGAAIGVLGRASKGRRPDDKD